MKQGGNYSKNWGRAVERVVILNALLKGGALSAMMQTPKNTSPTLNIKPHVHSSHSPLPQ
jgi:hypothetical protein